MRLGLNLRGDLAKLDDGELGRRFELALDERERITRSFGSWDTGLWFYDSWPGRIFGRGPFHARIFYRAVSILLFLVRIKYGGSIDYGSEAFDRLYPLDCEIKDLRDEIARRLKARSTGPTSASP